CAVDWLQRFSMPNQRVVGTASLRLLQVYLGCRDQALLVRHSGLQRMKQIKASDPITKRSACSRKRVSQSGAMPDCVRITLWKRIGFVIAACAGMGRKLINRLGCKSISRFTKAGVKLPVKPEPP